VNELLEASLRFPTVVFTIGLGIALIYWLFVLLGALDIDLLGGGEHGGIDLNGDGIPDIVAVKGAAHGDHDVPEGFMAKLGLGVVPLTISVSLIMLCGWVGSLLVMEYAAPSLGGWVKMAALPVVLIGSIVVTSIVVRPLAPVFRITSGKSNRDYIGTTCTITTGNVDEKFGQATIEDGGTTLDIPVRCDRTGKLSRGDKALIIDFDETRQAYLVEPAADMLASDKSGASS
jgi:hypothetical protein